MFAFQSPGRRRTIFLQEYFLQVAYATPFTANAPKLRHVIIARCKEAEKGNLYSE